MLDNLFSSVLALEDAAAQTFSAGTFLLLTLCSLVLGVLVTAVYCYKNTYTKSFMVTLCMLPAIVQMVIMLVNGNLGAGVAVMGAFSLVRFRSVPGTAREICALFMAMAVGLSMGMGYIGFAVAFVIILGAFQIILMMTRIGEPQSAERTLRITIPEDLDYTEVFDDLLEKYTSGWELTQVRTVNMGSLFRLQYRVTLRDTAAEKKFIDALRCRNGNLEIFCGRVEHLEGL